MRQSFRKWKKIFLLRLSVNNTLSRASYHNVYRYKSFSVEEIKISLIWKETSSNMLMSLKPRFWNITAYSGLRLLHKDITMEQDVKKTSPINIANYFNCSQNYPLLWLQEMTMSAVTLMNAVTLPTCINYGVSNSIPLVSINLIWRHCLTSFNSVIISILGFWFIWFIIFSLIACCIIAMRRRRNRLQYIRVAQPAYGATTAHPAPAGAYQYPHHAPSAPVSPPQYTQPQVWTMLNCQYKIYE